MLFVYTHEIKLPIKSEMDLIYITCEETALLQFYFVIKCLSHYKCSTKRAGISYEY